MEFMYNGLAHSTFIHNYVSSFMEARILNILFSYTISSQVYTYSMVLIDEKSKDMS